VVIADEVILVIEVPTEVIRVVIEALVINQEKNLEAVDTTLEVVDHTEVPVEVTEALMSLGKVATMRNLDLGQENRALIDIKIITIEQEVDLLPRIATGNKS
jgi:hypothetical protein